MPETLVRLPDPKNLEQYLLDRNSVQKLKKAIAQALAALPKEDRDQVTFAFRSKSPDQSLEDFLTKEATGRWDPVSTKAKGQFAVLLQAIQIGSKGRPSIHPGYVGSRTLTTEEKRNVNAAIERAEEIVRAIVDTPVHDAYVTNVFGGRSDDAKKVFDLGIAAVKRLAAQDAVLVDEVQKATAWGCQALTSEDQMVLSSAQASSAALYQVIVHEMTHALPTQCKTGDKYYRSHPGFERASEDRKVRTADHYAEVVARIVSNDPGAPMVPRDASEKSDTPDKVLTEYRSKATTLVTAAWATGINIYSTLAKFGAHAENHVQPAPSRFNLLAPTRRAMFTADQLAFASNASKLLGMTIHKRGTLNPADNPVTRLDLSILDNKLNVLGRLITDIKKVITLDTDTRAFADDQVDHVLSVALREYLSRHGGRHLLAKDADKDVAVIRGLAELNDAPDWRNYFQNLARAVPVAMQRYV